ncbi:CPBP family intramembrane metalloprotease, partial [Mycobacterium ulcerans]
MFRVSRLRALALAAGLVSWSLASPRLPARWRVALQAVLGGLLVLVTRAPLGLTPPRLWAGLRLG